MSPDTNARRRSRVAFACSTPLLLVAVVLITADSDPAQAQEPWGVRTSTPRSVSAGPLWLTPTVVQGLSSDRYYSLVVTGSVKLGEEHYGNYYKGYYGDAARTFAVGEIGTEARRLMQITEESLYLGIEEARVGNRLGDISAAVQNHVENAGFSVVRDFVGHGIGRNLHEDPQIPNYGRKGRGVALKAGMVLAIEPMVNAGTYKVVVQEDGWTVVTEDGQWSAHFEHCIAITENGPRILSQSPVS